MKVLTSSENHQPDNFNDNSRGAIEATMSDFTFYLQTMKAAVDSPKIKIPLSALSTDESFDDWLDK